MKLLVVNRPSPGHTERLGLGKGHPVPPAQQAAGGGGDSGNPVNNVLRHLPFMYLNLSEDLKRYKALLLKHKHVLILLRHDSSILCPNRRGIVTVPVGVTLLFLQVGKVAMTTGTLVTAVLCTWQHQVFREDIKHLVY